ncbi:tyrosine-type recombinase/integrase [Enterobacter hormaechei]|uniref:tyrosine-type recombinase/integrase n=1 Tax=Enterobacter hormaechei TaxID=158836 RepID=UPI00295A3385|nr:tyrosine-type recombinase/integrase [Enterobacter hormaechei]ELT0447262.1 tyrosine-type recombinase/integrase [Enterobacter hormaechei subsp. xiangfangensis]ELX8366537.1 tyrosine-type recombinase/integrase [Enterobacter hormaechei]MDY7150654.1 tyrosine-type recombinase/integrase [Enterobacter hormaechei]
MLISPNEHSLILAERWLKLLSDLGRAQATLTAYRNALRHYFAFCSQNGIEPEKARFEDLAAYLSPQLPGMPFPAASATLQLRLSAIRLWYDFLIYLDLCTVNPLPRSGTPGMLNSGRGLVPRVVKLPRIPDDAQWQSFLYHAAASPLRDRLMLSLTYYGALRRSEITALSIEDLDFAHRLIRIRAETTKNRRERIVCYSPAVTPVLAAHLMQMKQAGIARGALFRSASDHNQDAPLSIWSWSKTIRKWALEAGLPDISTHTFRHLRLTHLARAGWKLHELATYAGHRDLATTQIYIHLSGRDLAARMAGAIETADVRMANLIFSAEK